MAGQTPEDSYEFESWNQALVRRLEDKSRACALRSRTMMWALAIIAALAIVILLSVTVFGQSIADFSESARTRLINEDLKKATEIYQERDAKAAELKSQLEFFKADENALQFSTDAATVRPSQKALSSEQSERLSADILEHERLLAALKEEAASAEKTKRIAELEAMLQFMQQGYQKYVAGSLARESLLRKQFQVQRAEIFRKIATADAKLKTADSARKRALDTVDALTERAKESAAKDTELYQQRISNDWIGAATRVATTAGAIGIAILLMQVFISSSRYYARLSENYAAQADAFEASDGDPELALKLMQNMMPSSIDFGKAPTTLYEKALDALAGAARRDGNATS